MDLEGNANKGAATAAKILQEMKGGFDQLDVVFRDLAEHAKSEDMLAILKAVVENSQKMRERMIADAEALYTFMGKGLEAMVQQDKVEKMGVDFSAAIDKLPTNGPAVRIEAAVEATAAKSTKPPALPARQPVGERTAITHPKDPADPNRPTDPPKRVGSLVDLS